MKGLSSVRPGSIAIGALTSASRLQATLGGASITQGHPGHIDGERSDGRCIEPVSIRKLDQAAAERAVDLLIELRDHHASQ